MIILYKISTLRPSQLFCNYLSTLTFAVEILGFEVWQDSNVGWLQQEASGQGLKLQCSLYHGQTFDLDIMIWPYTAKIWCGSQYGWVRTWLFLERRWLAFTISYAFPVRVADLQTYVATIVPTVGTGSFGLNAKSDKNFEVYLPPLEFGVPRYFAPVIDSEDNTEKFVQQLIWHAVEKYIPWSCFDILTDVPHVVTDVRHQATCIEYVRDLILSCTIPEDFKETPVKPEPEENKHKERKESTKKLKEKDKINIVDTSKTNKLEKWELQLSGESILAGTGRIVPFETVGRPPDSPKIIVLISSNNLPAQDDQPIVFLNVENLCQIPLNELKILRVTHLYTKWQIGEQVHSSLPQPIKSNTTISLNDHRALVIPSEQLPKITSEFLDTSFIIELRGIRSSSIVRHPKLFGYEKCDRDYGKSIPKTYVETLDFIIAITKINAKSLSKGGVNAFLRGEFPLYPPRVTVNLCEREGLCTNDINSIRAPLVPELVVQPDVVLKAQMTLEVSIGVVGCKTRKLTECYSRMFCVIKDSDTVMKIIRCIANKNDDVMLSSKKEDLMTGFALDTGSVVVMYVEGPRDGNILSIWDMTEDFYPNTKPFFSCSDRYSTRIYPELLAAAVPFIILKMFVPIGVLLACPPVYSRPALPLLTRSAILKIGNLIERDLHTFPPRCQMPTTAELKSFRLELCVAPRPSPVVIAENNLANAPSLEQPRPVPLQSSRINWDK